MIPTTTYPRANRGRPSSLRHMQRRSASTRKPKYSLTVIPIRLDQTPGEVCWSTSYRIEPSETALTITLERDEPLPGRSVVVGCNVEGPGLVFAKMEIESQQQQGSELQITAVNIDDPADDLLSDSNLTPRINATNFCFEYGLPEDILAKWESLGVLRRYLVDRIMVCADCGSIPTWRHACPQCGSGRYKRKRLIHHFACAHVGHAESFRSADGAICCPKCQATRLIAGTDFRFVAGPLDCFDCGESGSQPTLWCMCHRCMSRFDPHETVEHELYGYHVDRMDLLDFIAASE